MRRAAEGSTETPVGRAGMSDSDREAATKCTRSVAAALAPSRTYGATVRSDAAPKS